MKYIYCTLVIYSTCITYTYSDEKVDLANKHVQEFIQQCETATNQEITKLPDKIKQSEILLKIIQRGAINPQLTDTKWIGTGTKTKVAFPSSEQKKASENAAKVTIDAMRIRLKNLKARNALTMAPLPDDLKVGDIGRPQYSFEVSQVVDESNVIVKYGDISIWLTNYDTKELADNMQIKYINCVQITGTKKYSTVAGTTRTILLVELFDGDSVIKAHIAAKKP